MGDVTGRDVGARGRAMGLLVIKEHVGLIGLQKLGFVQSPQENGLVG